MSLVLFSIMLIIKVCQIIGGGGGSIQGSGDGGSGEQTVRRQCVWIGDSGGRDKGLKGFVKGVSRGWRRVMCLHFSP